MDPINHTSHPCNSDVSGTLSLGYICDITTQVCGHRPQMMEYGGGGVWHAKTGRLKVTFLLQNRNSFSSCYGMHLILSQRTHPNFVECTSLLATSSHQHLGTDSCCSVVATIRITNTCYISSVQRWSKGTWLALLLEASAEERQKMTFGKWWLCRPITFRRINQDIWWELGKQNAGTKHPAMKRRGFRSFCSLGIVPSSCTVRNIGTSPWDWTFHILRVSGMRWTWSCVWHSVVTCSIVFIQHVSP